MIANTYLFHSKQSLNNLLNFSINLMDGNNKLIKFSSGEQKNKHFKL